MENAEKVHRGLVKHRENTIHCKRIGVKKFSKSKIWAFKKIREKIKRGMS